jgi:hypothetical protein
LQISTNRAQRYPRAHQPIRCPLAHDAQHTLTHALPKLFTELEYLYLVSTETTETDDQDRLNVKM